MEKIQSEIDEKKIHLNTNVVSLSLSDNKIKKIHAKRNGEDIVYSLSKDDILVNTLPINIIQNSFKDFFEEFIKRSNKVLKMNDLFLVFLSIKKQNYLKSRGFL